MFSSESSESTWYCGRLHRDVVDDAVLRIEPERRRRLRAARQRDQHVLADVGGATAPSAAAACGPSAGSTAGPSRRWCTCASTAPGICRIALASSRGERRVGRQVRRRVNCTSIAAGRPKFRICVTMSAGWKKNSMPGKRFGSSRAQQRHELVGRPVALAQRQQDLAVERADRAGVAVRQVDAAVGHAEVVEDGLELVRGMSSRIAASTASARRAVSSIRVPVGARMCSRIWPASTLGKKSRPSTG